MAKTPEEMAAAMVANLKEKTGKTLPQWLKIVGKCGQEKHGKVVKYLKAEYELTHGYANLIAHRALTPAREAEIDSVALQYSGKKERLRPIYDALSAAVRDLGADVEFAPKKAYVSLRRSKQFGLIQPSTATRVDLGLKLKNTQAKGRLEASGSFNAMVTHRVRLTDVSDVDAAVKRWLKRAYANA